MRRIPHHAGSGSPGCLGSCGHSSPRFPSPHGRETLQPVKGRAGNREERAGGGEAILRGREDEGRDQPMLAVGPSGALLRGTTRAPAAAGAPFFRSGEDGEDHLSLRVDLDGVLLGSHRILYSQPHTYTVKRKVWD